MYICLYLKKRTQLDCLFIIVAYPNVKESIYELRNL